MSTDATDSESEYPSNDPFNIKNICDKLGLTSDEESEGFELHQDKFSVKSDATMVSLKPKNGSSLLDDVCSELETTKIFELRLTKWVLYMREEFRLQGTTFLKKLQHEAHVQCSFIIENPEIKYIGDYLSSLKDIQLCLNTNSKTDSPFKLFMAIIPGFNAHALYIKLKETCNTNNVTSQLIQEPTLSTNFPISRLIESIRVKAGVDPYNNPRSLIGQMVRVNSIFNLEAKLFEGSILVPHESRFHSDQGTRVIKGKLTINDDGKVIALDYEKISLVNWPTFYPDDTVRFRIKFNDAQTHFAIYDLMLKPCESFALSKETRVQGRLHKFSSKTHSGMFVTLDSRVATFRRDEMLLDANFDFVRDLEKLKLIGRIFEFTLLPTSLGYLRAIRILLK